MKKYQVAVPQGLKIMAQGSGPSILLSLLTMTLIWPMFIPAQIKAQELGQIPESRTSEDKKKTGEVPGATPSGRVGNQDFKNRLNSLLQGGGLTPTPSQNLINRHRTSSEIGSNGPVPGVNVTRPPSVILPMVNNRIPSLVNLGNPVRNSRPLPSDNDLVQCPMEGVSGTINRIHSTQNSRESSMENLRRIASLAGNNVTGRKLSINANAEFSFVEENDKRSSTSKSKVFEGLCNLLAEVQSLEDLQLILAFIKGEKKLPQRIISSIALAIKNLIHASD